MNIVADESAFDPSAKHAYFREGGQLFEVTFVMGAGWPGCVKALRPRYRHLGMIDWDDEEAAREIARTYLRGGFRE